MWGACAMRVFAFLICGLFLAPALSATKVSAQRSPAEATQRPAAQTQGSVRRSRPDEPSLKIRLNRWTVGLAAGRLEGGPLRFAAELARVLDDGNNFRVLPVVTRGPFDNVFDLLYLNGVDAAILHGD